MQTKRNVFLWVLYDFANSILMIVFFLYFAQWIVIDRGVPDLYFNITFAISSLLLFFTVPFTGFLLDKHWRRITGLRYTTIFTALAYFVCSLAVINNMDLTALVFFTIGIYFYLMSFTFYTPLLNDISNENKRGFVSGLGLSANHLGQIAGLLIVLPLSTGLISFFGATPRAETLLPSVLIFFILSLPTLIFFKEPKKPYQNISFKQNIKETLAESRIIFSLSSVGLFLIAYFLFNDAILTASNNFSIFLEQVWHISDVVKTYILLGILATSAIGAIISGYIADKFGHKRTLMFILIGWLIIFPVLAFLKSFILFVIFTIIMGLWFGANWTVSRSLMSRISPKGKHNLSFAYFGLAERASSIIGPITWGLVVTGLVSLGEYRYRIVLLVMTLFILVGLFLLSRVKDNKISNENFK